MAADVEAVIAALRVALEEAQKSDEDFWKVEAANRWVGQLPGGPLAQTDTERGHDRRRCSRGICMSRR
jgi:hypothetical protein